MRLIVLLLSLMNFVNAQETPSNFTGTCVIRAIRNVSETQPLVWRTYCRCEDLPTPGFSNRYRFTFYGDAPERFEMPRVADMVRAEAVNGTLLVRSVLWGEMIMTPLSATIRERFTLNSGYEVRPQHLQLGKNAEGALELLMEEPHGEFDGKRALTPWLDSYAQSLALLSHAH